MSRTHSPSHRRSRLSSPTFDNAFADLSAEDMSAFEEINERLTQSSSSEGASAFPRLDFTKSSVHPSVADDLSMSVDHDPENPFTSGFSSAAKLRASGFQSSSALVASSSRLKRDRSPSPDEPREPDWHSWFDSDAPLPPVSFQTAAATFQTAAAPAGFMTASSKTWQPSSAALQAAKAKMKQWEAAESKDADPPDLPAETAQAGLAAESASTFQSAAAFKSPSATFSTPLFPASKRPALSAMENITSPAVPATPTPQGVSRPSRPALKSPAMSPNMAHRPKPFRSPLINKSQTPLKAGPSSSTSATSITVPRSHHKPHPLATSITAPMDTDREGEPRTPRVKLPVEGPVHKKPRLSFTTPFKGGAPPTQVFTPPIASSSSVKTTAASKAIPVPPVPQQPTQRVFFDLSRRKCHKTLRGSLIFPQTYTGAELESMGITNLDTLKRITPDSALFYTFTSDDSDTPDPANPFKTYGAKEALERLIGMGCKYATKPWVDNHYALILWKLAGMIALDPKSENDLRTRRWCFKEVIRQLLYRYERELNLGQRPTLRLVTTQDAPSEFPMVLCVSKITWSSPSISEDGEPIPPQAELELTDGWYRLRAVIDAPLTNAVRRGIIAVGRKIGTAGTKLVTEKKDPQEVLEAYGSVRLVLNGNSAQMMPWYVKLGWYMKGPCIATLNKLSPHGGTVSVLDAVVLRTYPVAFVEFFEDEDGNRASEPRSREEENRRATAWRLKRDQERARMKVEVNTAADRYDAHLEQLMYRGKDWPTGDPPENLEEMFEMLDETHSANKLLNDISPHDAAHLAMYIRDRLRALREEVYSNQESKLDRLVPPRIVRSFRVIVVQDARVSRRPKNRVAKITVWDALKHEFVEGRGPGDVREGDRYLITNLAPSQPSAWMGPNERGAEVYLVTKPHTKWKCITAQPGKTSPAMLYEMT